MQASAANDVDALLDTLAEHAELISPLSGRMIFRGRDDMRTLATAVYGTISNLRWSEQTGDEHTRVAIGSGSIGPFSFDDAMIFELAGDGKIARLRPHLRPWLGLTAFALAVAPKMLPHPGVVLGALLAKR
jgi:hypothetical protein